MLRKRAGNKSFAVFGMGEFGKNVVRELAKNNADVLAIDSNEEELKEVIDDATESYVMDVTDPSSYAKLSLSEMDAVVIAMAEHMDASIMAIMHAAEAGVDTIIVKSLDEVHSKIYQKVGATKIIIPEMIEGISVARAMTINNTLDYYALDDESCIVEVYPHPNWIGRSLRELDLTNTYNMNIIGIVRNERVDLIMSPDTIIEERARLLIASTKRSFENLFGKDTPDPIHWNIKEFPKHK